MNRKLVSGLSVLAAAVGLFVVYLTLARSVPTNSDDAAVVLQVQSMLHGNSLLKGWHMPPDTFLTTDIPFYLAGMLIFGYTPFLMHIVPAAIYTVVVLLCVRLAATGRANAPKRYKSLVTFVLVGLPTAGLAFYVFQGPIHLGTMLFVLLALILLDTAASKGTAGQPTLKWMIGFSAVLAWAIIGDPYTLWVVVYPAILVALIGYLRDGNRHFDRSLLIAAVIAAVVGKGVAFAIPHLGGYSPQQLHPGFVALSALVGNILKTLEGMLSLFDANFFGRKIGSLGTVKALIHLIGLVTVCWILRQFTRHFRHENGTDRISQIIAVAAVINLLSYMLSDRPGIDAHTARYIVPFALFGSILVGRWGLRFVQTRRISLVLAGIGIVYALLFIPELAAKPSYSPYVTLGSWLQSHGLKYGYGSYWDASIVTVQTRDAVVVRPVTIQDHHIATYHWLADAHWYDANARQENFNFLVYDDDRYQHLDLASITSTFGPPAQTFQVGQFHVLVWNGNIAEKVVPFKGSY